MHFIQQLRLRNSLLYWFGWLMLFSGIICGLLTQVDNTIILGINAWIKPMKFFISTYIFCWTMGWILTYLNQPNKERLYTIMVVMVMTLELAIITYQAANGRMSHFNINSPLYAALFAAMGIAITILGIWTAYINYLFFRLKPIEITASYLWGIRLGILFFVIFSFEGGWMAARLSHTVGAPDGTEGLFVVNWSKSYGDLRIAHFFGLHSLQILPLIGFYISKNGRTIVFISILYFAFVSLMLVQAMMGKPMLRF